LRETEEWQLCVAWLQTDLIEEAHHQNEFQESFLILEGTCECDLGGKIIRLQPGGYLDIPFDTPHVIKVTTPENGFVKALIQRRKVAA
jgi:quercetin dioxygenase-like cupin family protein